MSFMFRGSFHRCDKKSEFCCTFCFFGHCGYPQHSQQSRLPRSSSSASGPPAQDLLGPPVQDTSTASNTQIKRRDAQGKSGSYPVVSLVTRSEKSSRRVEETLNPDLDNLYTHDHSTPLHSSSTPTTSSHGVEDLSHPAAERRHRHFFLFLPC